jgi:hypothetical protein
MTTFSSDYTCPPWLEDEALLIEHAGEMPEVALAESLHLLGELRGEDLLCLRAACARAYLRSIKRDLDPANIGSPAYRGLERARTNLARLQNFLAGLGAEISETERKGLAAALVEFLNAEQNALKKGRAYAASPAGEVRSLAQTLHLGLTPWQGLLMRMAELPSPDFIGLRALKRLQISGAAIKRRMVRGEHLRIELWEPGGKLQAAAALPWHSDAPAVAAENRARAEMVWLLIDAPAEDDGNSAE